MSYFFEIAIEIYDKTVYNYLGKRERNKRKKKEETEMSREKIDLIQLGKNIKSARECSKFSQSDLAAFLGVDQSLISKFESGERAISSDMLERIASFLCYPVKDLLCSNNINPTGKVAFRTDGLCFDDNRILANVNNIILNQIEMDRMIYGND